MTKHIVAELETLRQIDFNVYVGLTQNVTLTLRAVLSQEAERALFAGELEKYHYWKISGAHCDAAKRLCGFSEWEDGSVVWLCRQDYAYGAAYLSGECGRIESKREFFDRELISELDRILREPLEANDEVEFY